MTALPVLEADALFGLWIIIGGASVSYGIILPVLFVSWMLTGFHRVEERTRDRVRVLVALPFIIAEVMGIMSSWQYYMQNPWPRVLRLGFAWIQGFQDLFSFIL